MNTNRILIPLAATAILGSAHAAVIAPTGATSTGVTALSNRPIGTTIDGSGLPLNGGSDLAETHTISTSPQYFIGDKGAGNTAENVQLDFDLNGAGSATFDLNAIHIWQFTTTQDVARNRGIGAVDIYFSTDNGLNYSASPVSVAFAISVQNKAQAAQTQSFTAVTGVTNVRLIADNLYVTNSIVNTDSRYLAFNEIRFGTVEGVPEPSAALLGGLGSLCLLRRRRA